MKKRWLIAGAVLVSAGLVLFCAAYFAGGSDLSTLDPVKYVSKTYTVDDAFERLEITAGDTDITFAPSTDGKCSVVCTEREKMGYSIRTENGKCRITTADERNWYDHLTFFSKTCSMTVYLPEAHYAGVSVDSGTGDVSVPETFSFDAAEITADTGDVTCRADVKGALRIVTDTGDIRLDGIKAGSIGLTVSTGRIDAGAIRCDGEFSVEISTGDAYLTDVRCSGLRSRGSTGRLTLTDTVAAGAFDLERSTGDVRFDNCDAGTITVKTSTGDVTGTLQTEKVFLVDTSTGDVHVPDTASGGKCEVRTSTGDIELKMADR
ncbi:MAG: DUF4097 family beta strand repeat protein [Clostridia bacterium]|nr:DUF4097 family beta strand repeat protein [Clostridia bacterium]